MSKYIPYAVIYHKDNNETEVVMRNNLEELGQTPIPSYAIGNNDYIFVGWTNQIPTNNEYYIFQTTEEFENENMTLFTKDTLVYESLELWPIYIQLQITVNSNIDSELLQNGASLDNVRNITRPSATETQINSKMTPFEDYVFVGWYENYQNETDKGQLLTTNTSYILNDIESIENSVYTAVYKKIFTINYYNKSGEIIYTAYADQDSVRTFVTQVEDENGNNIEIPIDSEAYEKIIETLAPNEMFINWKWQKEQNTVIDWNSFYNQPIISSMNLYPKIRRVEATDSNGENVDIIVGEDNGKINVCLNEEYDEPNIDIHVEEIDIGPGGTSQKIDASGVEVDIYKDTDITSLPIGKGTTDENGNSTIDLYGEIIIKHNSSITQNEDVFIYQLLDENENVINEINVNSNEDKIIKVSFGNYKIRRKSSWAWRYAQGISDLYNIDNKNCEQEALFDKSRLIIKWFDSTSYIENKYE